MAVPNLWRVPADVAREEMTRAITKSEWKRRSMVASAELIMTKAMGQANDETGGLYYSEWLKVLNTMQTRLISDMLRDDWDKPDPCPNDSSK
jgi:hypothetical protein